MASETIRIWPQKTTKKKKNEPTQRRNRIKAAGFIWMCAEYVLCIQYGGPYQTSMVCDVRRCSYIGAPLRCQVALIGLYARGPAFHLPLYLMRIDCLSHTSPDWPAWPRNSNHARHGVMKMPFSLMQASEAAPTCNNQTA